MARLKASKELHEAIVDGLDKRGPFVAHGKDLFVKWDEIRIETSNYFPGNPITPEAKMQISFVLSYLGKEVGVFSVPDISPGDSITLDGLAGDFELPLSIV